MKRVLILSVIAMLALGVFALAASSFHAGPQCSPATLTVNSNVVVVQGFEATATAYDATFCGATGNPLTGGYTSPNSGYSKEAGYVLLASLTVKSNMNNIGVEFEALGDPMLPTLLNLSHADFLYYINGTAAGDSGAGSWTYYGEGVTFWPSWYYSSTPYYGVTLLGNNSPYEGELDVLMSNIPAWVQAGKYPLTMYFYVFPKTSGF